MGINRRAARRDENEPAIRKRFAHHGWHTEQLSGTGMPDLLVWPRFYPIGQEGRRSVLVDVKMPDGKVTKPQAEKWKALASKGIPVYVVRTNEDVDALVDGTLEAWRPEAQRSKCGKNGCRRLRPCMQHDDDLVPRRLEHSKPRSHYTPPRGERMGAAKVAEETFAPSFQCPHGPACVHGCEQ